MPGVRIDSGVVEGGDGAGALRSDARESDRDRPRRETSRLPGSSAALRAFPILGIRTNIPFLLRVLEHPRFRAGDDRHRLPRPRRSSARGRARCRAARVRPRSDCVRSRPTIQPPATSHEPTGMRSLDDAERVGPMTRQIDGHARRRRRLSRGARGQERDGLRGRHRRPTRGRSGMGCVFRGDAAADTPRARSRSARPRRTGARGADAGDGHQGARDSRRAREEGRHARRARSDEDGAADPRAGRRRRRRGSLPRRRPRAGRTLCSSS